MKYIFRWVKENYKEYILVSLLFTIGLFVGVMLVNNCNDEQRQEVNSYIQDFITNFKSENNVNKIELIKISIKNNLILTGILWIAGTTVIGLPIVLCIILYRGLCLGYTVSAFSYVLGKFGGIIFCLITIFIQNLFFIPAILTLGVSSIKLYKSIVKDRDKQNIKLQIIRHIIILGIVNIFIIIASLLENIVSVSVLQIMIKYF